MREKDLRLAIVACCRRLQPLGVNQGAVGNVSARLGDMLFITPSGVPYDTLQPEMIASMPVFGEYGAWRGPLKPSSEWRFHLDIYRARPDVGAIVHTHALYATTLSMLRKPIPAAHYMVAAFGGPDVRCAPYATFGTKELSDHALAGLKDRHAVLLANHGAIACGADLAEALWRMTELETLAKMYHLALAVGKPAILPEDEIERVIERFKTYGSKAQAAPAARTGATRAKPGSAKAKSTKLKTAKTKAAKAKAPKVKSPKVTPAALAVVSLSASEPPPLAPGKKAARKKKR